jgi:hypothetical protein
MGVHFDKIKIGEYFEVDGEMFKKLDELMFQSIARIEQMIDPIWDKKIGRTAEEKAAAAAQAAVDTSAKVIPASESPDVDPSVVK